MGEQTAEQVLHSFAQTPPDMTIPGEQLQEETTEAKEGKREENSKNDTTGGPQVNGKAKKGILASIGRFLREIFGQFLTAEFWKEIFSQMLQEAMWGFMRGFGATLNHIGESRRDAKVRNTTINSAPGTASMASKAFGAPPMGGSNSAPRRDVLSGFGFVNS